LTDVIIPARVSTIGDFAFYNNRLTNITFVRSGVTFGSTITNNSSNLVTAYSRGGAGRYTRLNADDNNWAKAMPLAFEGTWKRDNFNNTLFLTANTLYASNSTVFWNLINVQNDSYTFSQSNRPSNRTAPLTIRLVNGDIVIAGDSGTGENNWNGTWKKVQ
jgi:hypothetical protein